MDDRRLDEAADERPPLLLVLSVGDPRSALQFWHCLGRGPLSGIYEASLSPLDAVLVDVRSLPARPGTALLRFFDHRPEVAEGNLRRLLSDPTIGKMTKDRLRRAIVNNPKAFERERPLILELEEFEERVREDDRQAFLAQARARLDPGQVAELEAIDDFQVFAARRSDPG